MVRVSLGLESELGLGRFWVTVINMIGLWLWLELTLPKTLTRTLDPNLQNEIVEGHP